MITKYVSHSGQPYIPSNGQNGNRLLRVSQVAEIMNAHPNSVRHWADRGLLPSYRIGRRGDRRFRVQDVDEFLRVYSKFQRLAAHA